MQPRIRTNTLTGYAGLARSLGLDPAALLAEVHLELAVLDVPGRWIPAGPAARLLELSAAQAGCPDFGLRMAALRRLGTLGPLSLVLRDEPDLRGAAGRLLCPSGAPGPGAVASALRPRGGLPKQVPRPGSPSAETRAHLGYRGI